MSSQSLEVAGWLAERILLSHDFQERRKIPAPSQCFTHSVSFLPGKFWQSKKEVVLALQEPWPACHRRGTTEEQELIRVHHSFFLVPLSMCNPITFDFLLLPSFQPPPWLARVGSSSVSLCCALPGASCLAVINCTEQCLPGCLHL